MIESPAVLYLSLDGLLSPLGRSQVLSYSLRLAGQGFRFHFVSMEPEAALRDEEQVSLLRSRLEQAGCEWTALPYRAARFSNLRALHRAAAGVASLGRIRLVHARSYLPAYVANRLRRSFGVPYLFDMRGCWIEECREQGRGFTDPFSYWIAKRIERSLVAKAAGIVTLTHLQAQDLGVSAGKTRAVARVIRTCCDRQQFFRAPDALQRIPADAAERLKGRNVICWVGSINSAYFLAPSLELFNRIRSLDKTAILLCLTQQVQPMREALRAHGVSESDAVVASVSYDEMPSWLSCAHWGLLLMQSTPARRGAMPTKLAEFLATGVRPIHLGCNDEVKELVMRSGFGLTMDSLAPGEMQRVAESVAAGRHLEDRSQPDPGVLDELDLTTGVREYAQVYKELLEHPTPLK